MLHHDYYLHRVEEKYFRDLSDLRKNKRREGKKNVSWLSHQAIELLFQNLELLHSMLYTVGPSYGSEKKKNTMKFEYALSFVLAYQS